MFGVVQLLQFPQLGCPSLFLSPFLDGFVLGGLGAWNLVLFTILLHHHSHLVMDSILVAFVIAVVINDGPA